MTAYFDEKTSELHRIREDASVPSQYKRIEELDRAIVYDVTLCAEQPGFIDDGSFIHAAVAAWKTAALKEDRDVRYL